jgi:hypothetical protein
MAKLSLERAATFFASGYVAAGLIVTVIARIQDETWLSGPVMLGFSAATSIVYFLVFWALRRWRFFAPTSVGMALAGCLCAFYPTVSGYFPVYFMRWELALPIIAIQLVLLAIVIVVCGWLSRMFGRAKTTSEA